jgi:hypothetical protein
MAARLKIWETLLGRAPELIDSAGEAMEEPLTNWTFGGGTVLMLRHHHRFSKDIDIFVPDPQWLGYFTPRLNDKAQSMTTDYVEAGNTLKLVFQEGEIDFVASASLTDDPWKNEVLIGRDIRVETSAEIVAKKVWHRGDMFTARDIFDLAMVCEKEPNALPSIQPILSGQRDAILARVQANERALRESFDALDVLDYRRTFDECFRIVRNSLGRA